MEGKTLIMSALLLSLVLGQIQAEEKKKSCCLTAAARKIYNTCRLAASQETCASLTACILQDDGKCRPTHPYGILENTAGDVYEYCKLGCTSSVCGAIATLQNSNASEVVNGAVEKCTQACSAFCTKGSIIAVATA